MLKNKNIICVASTAWETQFLQNIVQMVSLLARDNKVLYVDYAFTWIDVLKNIIKRGTMPIWHILGLKNRIRKISTEYHTELYLLSLPPVLPINWINNRTVFDWFNKLNYYIILRSVKKAQRRLALDQPIYINSWNPIFGINYRGELKEQLLVYHCYDEMSASKWMKKHGARLETAYLPMPDVVITTSKELKNTKSRLNANCHVVPNGVNFELFNSYLSKRSHDTHIDKTGYNHIIGYIGAIDDRIDPVLMQFAIEKCPDYLFVFIGRVTHNTIKSSLEKFNNVKFIPPVSPSELPAYVNEFSLCIIPFVKNEFTVNVYPLKINEYLAMGKPVVLTDFSDLNEFAATCQIVTTAEAFIIALKTEIDTDTEEKKNQRIYVASENSWKKRAEAFSEILYTALESKK